METTMPTVVIATVSEFLDLVRYLDEAADNPESVTAWLLQNFLWSPRGMIPKPLGY